MTPHTATPTEPGSATTPHRPETTILILDPDVGSRAAIASIVEAAGFFTLTAPDMRSAKELTAMYDVSAVILDPRGGPGQPDECFDRIDRLRRHPSTADLPILVVSTLAEQQHRVEGLRRGADDYLVKPFIDDELILRLELRLGAPRRGRLSAAGPLLRHALALGELKAGVGLGRYRAERVIGRGAMGVVLRGIDPQLQRPVAIKVLGQALSQPLWSEGSALARFDHPHIVKVYDAGSADDLPYLVMELVEGASLADRLGKQPFDLRQTLTIAAAVAKALEAAHGEGWIHRDIKPANILLGDDGSIKVTDFGLAGVAASLEASDRIFGTPGYAPPECLIGEPHTASGDLFALGSVLYFLLAGRPAFAGETLGERLAATVAGRYTPIETLNPAVPRPLRKLVDQLLSPLPSGRPESAAGVARRLEWIAGALNVPALSMDDLEPAETMPVRLH